MNRRFQFHLVRLVLTGAAAGILLPAPGAAMASSRPAGAAAAAQPTTAAEVMECVRASLHYPALESHASGIIMRGNVSMAGLESKVSMLFNAAGNSLVEIDGRVGRTVGFDGTTAWERNESGVSRVLSLTDREIRLAIVEFQTMSWLSPNSQMQFTLNAEKTTAQSYVLSFTRGQTGVTGTVEIDAGSGEPRTVTVVGTANPDTLRFGDYADFEGLRLYRHFAHETEDGDPTTADFTEVSRAPQYFRNPYEPVLSLPQTFRFDPAVPARVDIRRAPTQHQLVKATINGEDVGWFIFDSGAGTEVLSLKVAEKLKLESFGKIPVRGVGGLVESGYYQPSSLTLGPLTVDKPLFIGLDISMLDQYMGVPVAGIIGYGVLGLSTTLIDARAGYLELHDSSTFQLPRGEWTPLLLYGRHPVVPGQVEGHDGYMRLDTGAAQMTITMHSPTVEKYKMLEDRAVKPTAMGGVGGMVEARTGILRSITLGGRTFDNIVATFALPDKGAMNDPGTLGNVGGMLLDPFVLVFDYPHQRMAFIPRENAPAPQAK